MSNKIIDLEVVDSTQTYIKNNRHQLDFYDSCFAIAQTNGYGRTGNWDSRFENLYFSKLLPVNSYNHLCAINSMHMLVAKYAPDVEIKVPNDLYYDGLKLGGFIIENFDDYAILGIGINVWGSAPEFTALKDFTNLQWDIHSLAHELDELINLNLTMPLDMMESYYKQNCKLIGKQIKYQDLSSSDIFTGIVTDLDSQSITIDSIKFNQMQIKILNK